MFRNSRRAGALLATLALVAFVASPALGATAKRSLTKLVKRYYGVPVQSMTKIDSTIDNTEPAMPLILVPSISLQQPVCRLNGQCYVAELEVCPMTIGIEQPDGQSYMCDLDCHGSTPNASHQCDCDVKLDTCKPI